MGKPIIEIEGLGKSYRIGANREKYLSLRDEMAKAAHGFYRRFVSRDWHALRDEEFWAIKDVSFSINEGETVGIIGRNGAGKSTLLKILSKITPPTTGKVTLRGRIASLLEVGTGFHPELTGRENIYLNGAILGMTRAEIKRKFDEIVAFAEVEKFLDTPVKRYSSGMYVRLAFAVAAHLEPEILIVDEVLAVGDAQFQKKCLGKLGEVAKRGRTVLFVSHNMAAVENLCERGLLMSKGAVACDGNTAETVAAHLGTPSGGNGAHGRYFKAVRSFSTEHPDAPLRCGDPITFEFDIDTGGVSCKYPFVGLGLDDMHGARIATVGSYFASPELPPLNGLTTVQCRIPHPNLAPGLYRLKVSLSDSSQELESIDNFRTFEMQPSDFYGNGKVPAATQGPMLLRSTWHTSQGSNTLPQQTSTPWNNE